MSTKQPGKKARYTRHSNEFKQEALKLAANQGVGFADAQLGLHESQLYQWRKQAEHHKTVSAREAVQAAEIARLKRELAE